MDTVARRPAELWASRATAPLRLARRHPGPSATLAGLLLLAAGWIWWATQLRGLPDIGDPFDVESFQAARVPDDRNAFFEYRDAASMFAAARRAMGRGNGPRWQTYTGRWSGGDPRFRDLAARTRPALDLWRSGSEKPDYAYEHGGPLSLKTLLPVTQELGSLGRMAILEGSRLEESGDVAGAWGWYRAALRSSRHNGRHGFQVERLGGAALHDEASKALTRWAADPRVDAAMLRRALAEVIAIDAMTAPRSETVKVNYLMLAAAMADPNLIEDVLIAHTFYDTVDWSQKLPVPPAVQGPIQTARVVVADDRERSLRVIRLMTANWLAEVDKPPSRRAPLVRADPPIYATGPGAPIAPEELAAWLDSSLFASRFFRAYQKYDPNIDKERPRQARLVVHLADQLYRREHGGPPPSPAALVGPYLKELPEGYHERP